MSLPRRPVRWQADPPAVVLLDQSRLPGEEVEVVCTDVDQLVEAIRRLAVRGAPLLGVVGAYGVALAALTGGDVTAAAGCLAGARPTAINLPRAVAVVAEAHRRSDRDPGAALLAAVEVEAAEVADAERLVAAGVPLVPAGARILTHCNTGELVSAGPGTAFGIVAAAHRRDGVEMLWIDETRPLLQGSRLTAYEAGRAGIPHSVLPDAAAGSLFSRGLVDLVLVGADRIAADGSIANKIGTYPLAVLAHRHGVPFLVAAPTSTVDLQTACGADIPVEERPGSEVLTLGGCRIAPLDCPAYNPAFDVTPPELVTALVTERGVLAPLDAAGLAEHCRPAEARP
ncbi:MAG TPA: S-methyl-5-thioribose-1-phosphate isomerase [Mycobacteriales bacterium]|nr:S-methyl-5-thioribose-1-phosphate isomerase [Mycobacteriales bacterium]